MTDAPTTDNSFQIPSPDGLERQIAADVRLMTGSKWRLAATVYAFTVPAQGHRTDLAGTSAKFPCSLSDFARLGFAGFTHRDTVARYRTAWEIAVAAGKAQP